MKYQTARELTMLDIDSMTLKQIQRHKVRLLDAWRESRAEYGFLQAVNEVDRQIKFLFECGRGAGSLSLNPDGIKRDSRNGPNMIHPCCFYVV